ncbi:MAG: cell division protein FtsA [Kiloniellales bacterium]|nr:cell division protein FtsA [Kiloniellales bacterium]
MRRGLGRMRKGLIAALDVGSSKICCFIAESDGTGAPRVIGIGQQASRGLRNGNMVDMEACQGAILSAVHAAEQMAGETISQVVVSLTGGHPASTAIGVEVSIAGHEVGDADLSRALRHGQRITGQNGESNGDADLSRLLIHSIPVGYSIDDSRGIRDPRGMYGQTLGVKLHLITARSGAVRNLATCIQRCHLDIAGFIVSPYASGLACLVEDETELGVTVIDMGGGTTTMAVFFEGNVIFTDQIPVGGIHVTNDIARGLSTPVSHAERLKTLYGHAMAVAADEREMIDVPQIGEDAHECETQQVARSILVGIIQPRLEETFELVRSHLEAAGFDKVAGRRVVLTGGACQLPGLRDLAALILDKQVRIGRPSRTAGLAEATSGPAYSTCAGLLACATASDFITPREATREEARPGGMIGRLGQWVRENF